MKISSSDLNYCKPSEFSIRFRAMALSQVEKNNITSPWHSKIDIYPHQIETVIKAINMDYPRLILADEVGLGKTIEAGLIIKEMIKKKKANNFLIISPSSLINQWHQEMFSKFDMPCEIINNSNINKILEGELYGGYIISVDLAKFKKDIISEREWDIAIFDEAHHIRRHFSKNGYHKKTMKYELGESMRDKSKSILFLTATPFQLNDFEFFSLIDIINKDLFQDYEQFKRYREIYLPKMNELLVKSKINEDCLYELKLLTYRLSQEFPSIFKSIDSNRDDLEKIISESNIIKKYVIRHKKRIEFPNSPPREVNTIRVNYTPEELNIYEKISNYAKNQYNMYKKNGNNGNGLVMVTLQQLLTSSPKALLKTIKKRIDNLEKNRTRKIDNNDISLENDDKQEDIFREFYSETKIDDEIAILKEFEENINSLKKDSKMEKLISLISNILINNPKEKIIIFTRFIETQRYIKELLDKHFKVAIFNGNLDRKEKDDEIEKFKNDYHILVSTESGGEGRNFQFCHVMINYDLPWNPVKIEQRIGRIDRIGQTKTVIVNNLSTFDTIEQKILDVLLSRINDFEGLFGPSDAIIGDIQDDIVELLMKQEKLTDEDTKRFEMTIEEKINKSRQAFNDFDKLMIFEKSERNRTELIKQESIIPNQNQMSKFIVDAINNISGASIKSTIENIFEINIPKEFENRRNDRTIFGTTVKEIAMKDNNIEFLTPNNLIVNEIIESLSNFDGIIVCGDISREDMPHIDLVFKIKTKDETRFVGVRSFNNKKTNIIENIDIFMNTDKDIDNKIKENISNYLNIINGLVDISMIQLNKGMDNFDIKETELIGIRATNFSRWIENEDNSRKKL